MLEVKKINLEDAGNYDCTAICKKVELVSKATLTVEGAYI